MVGVIKVCLRNLQGVGDGLLDTGCGILSFYDHMAVNGINQVICAQNGEEIKPKAVAGINQYANRLFHLLKDSVHVAPAAILYHAEVEWSGEFMHFQTPAKILSQNQIDYDVIPADIFEKREHYKTWTEKGRLHINQESYRILIIPYVKRIPASVAVFIQEAAMQEIKVCFVNGYPEGICGSSQPLPEEIDSCDVVPLEEMGAYVKEHNYAGSMLEA